MKRYIKCKSPELYGRFIARGYYDTRYSGLADSFESSDYEYIKDKVHDMLSNGECVEVEDTLTGASYRIDPDTYFEDFEGEFNVTKEMQDFQGQIINSSRKISKSKVNASLENDTELAVQLVDIVNEFDHYEYDDNSEGFVYDVIDMADKLDDKDFRDDIVTTLHYYIDEVKDSNYAGYDSEKEAKKFLDKCEDAINKLEHFQPIAASKRIPSAKITATEYVDVHNLADDSQFSVKPSEVYDLLNNYTGDLRNLETGWVGTVMQLRPELSYQPYAIVFGLEYDNNDRDYIYLYPQDSDRRSCIMYMGQYGMPKFANSIQELRRILSVEFDEFERI